MRFIILFIFLFPGTLLAKKGFTENPADLPPTIKKAWNSVFKLQSFIPKRNRRGQIVGEDVAHGTAAIIGRKGNTTYLLTAYHVPEEMGCKNKGKTCSKSTVLVQRRNGYEYFRENGVKLIRKDKMRDLAIVSIQSEKLSDPNEYPVIPLTQTCPNNPEKPEENYLIGYPKMEARYKTRHWMHTKRWSQGHQSIRIDKQTKKEQLYYYTIRNRHGKRVHIPYSEDYSSADSLGGNSGGPSFNKKGEIIGVLIGGADAKDYGHRNSRAYVKKGLNHSRIADCDAMLKMAKDIPGKKLLPVQEKKQFLTQEVSEEGIEL